MGCIALGEHFRRFILSTRHRISGRCRGIKRLLFGLLRSYHDLLALLRPRKPRKTKGLHTTTIHDNQVTTLAPELTPFACIHSWGLHTTDYPGCACAAFRGASDTTRDLQLRTRIVEAARSLHAGVPG